ncbi:hypothetical protein ACHAL6_04290 [Proteiniclasticum sp. C24MP]|uniref:hypothetical protein n=1 Tax=Proteiniclasticum sp. C24MP TaxID=3374101 RepID=UPI0037546D20
MNIFFGGAVMMVLFCFLVLTKEASDMRFRRQELEQMLQFDYTVEAYYLLLDTGGLSLDQDRGYGSFNEYIIRESHDEDRYIEITDREDHIQLTGYYSGKKRVQYEIWK